MKKVSTQQNWKKDSSISVVYGLSHWIVIESCRAQIRELQKSVDNLQKSDKDLRLSVRLAEMRAQESELKLHHCKEHYHKTEHNYKGLEKEYKRLYKKHKELEKYLQKKAVLDQISTEQNIREKSNSQSYEKMSPSVSLCSAIVPWSHPIHWYGSHERFSLLEL